MAELELTMVCLRCGVTDTAERMPTHLHDTHGLTVARIDLTDRWPDGSTVDLDDLAEL